MRRISQLIALLLTICAVSCQKQDVAQDSSAVNVTFSVHLPGLPSKAIGQASDVDMLFYMPFIITNDGDGKEEATPVYENVRAAIIDVSTLQTDIVIPFDKGLQYKVVFWAQNKDCRAYHLGNDLREVIVDYNNASSNDDSRDAFYHCESIAAEVEMTRPVMLARPFAQINFASNSDDWSAAQHFLSEGMSSSVEFSASVPNVLNTLTGLASGSVPVVFTEGVSPALTPAKQSGETLMDVDGENYKGWLSMNYILANPVNQPNIQSVKATFFYDGASCDYTVYDVPFLRNHRTNIIGYFLSESYDVDVKIVKDFYDDIIF